MEAAATRMRAEKRCIMCEATKPAAEFYQVRYVTNQGKRSLRLEPRCKPCARARRLARYAVKGPQERATSNRWKNENREQIAAYNRTRQADPDHRAMKAKAQRQRKARMRSGQGDNAAIRSIYAQAVAEEKLIANCPVFAIKELGYKLHVDHIMPLSKGGEHHESNLQILPIGINMRKGAKCPR